MGYDEFEREHQLPFCLGLTYYVGGVAAHDIVFFMEYSNPAQRVHAGQRAHPAQRAGWRQLLITALDVRVQVNPILSLFYLILFMHALISCDGS